MEVAPAKRGRSLLMAERVGFSQREHLVLIFNGLQTPTMAEW
jgi:hypothetical protein